MAAPGSGEGGHDSGRAGQCRGLGGKAGPQSGRRSRVRRLDARQQPWQRRIFRRGVDRGARTSGAAMTRTARAPGMRAEVTMRSRIAILLAVMAAALVGAADADAQWPS